MALYKCCIILIIIIIIIIINSGSTFRVSNSVTMPTSQFSAYQDCCDDQSAYVESLAQYVAWLHLDLRSFATMVQEMPPEMHSIS